MTGDGLLPKHFCWSKIGAESGEELDLIIKRKELERLSGNGLFVWGIGNSVINSTNLLNEKSKPPKVFFSPIKSKARIVDRDPSGIVMWSHYVGQDGLLHTLPDHSFVTSRFDGVSESSARHYALFCHSNESIMDECDLIIEADKLQNLRTGSTLGFSQVTSIVSLDSRKKIKKSPYKVRFHANLLEPFCVKLAVPVKIDRAVILAMNKLISSRDTTQAEWQSWLKAIKSNYHGKITKSHQLHLNITA